MTKTTIAPKSELPPVPTPTPTAPTLEVSPVDGQEVATDPPPKVKKVLSEKKKEAMAKMFEGLKKTREMRRETLERETDEAKEARKQEKLKIAAESKYAKKRPPVTQYVTMRDLEAFRADLIGILPKTVYKEVPVDRLVPHPVPIPVETVREKIVQVPQKITGNALLDSIFFR